MNYFVGMGSISYNTTRACRYSIYFMNVFFMGKNLILAKPAVCAICGVEW